MSLVLMTVACVPNIIGVKYYIDTIVFSYQKGLLHINW